MKTVILAGGLGTRLREETEFRPKPMVEIGGRPILWHIMKLYAHYGHKDFILCLGYKGDVIRDYFLNYRSRNCDVTLTLGSPNLEVHNGHSECGWNVTLAETGHNTMTAGRLKHVRKYLDGDVFLATYGDGLADIDIPALIDCHRQSGKLATVTAVRPSARFGELSLKDGLVQTFEEKPQVSNSWVNGGFLVMNPRVLDMISSDDETLEKDVLRRLALMHELAVYQHSGFWQCMDTLRESELLNKLWSSGEAPWKLWRSDESPVGQTETPLLEIDHPIAGPPAQSSSGECLGCGNPLPESFLDLGTMPLANSYVSPESVDPEPAFPLCVTYCQACHLVQLTDVVSPKDLFSEYLYFSSYSESYLKHARLMAESLISKFRLGPSSRVVEIASNDGYLLQFFKQQGIPVRGVEPAANIARCAIDKGIPTDNRFFDPAYAKQLRNDFGPANLIIGNNVLAHVPSINEFLRAVHDCLAADGVAVFEFPHLMQLVNGCEFDTIYHEHVFYFSLWAVRTLAARAGLEVVDVEPQKVHGGSLRVFLRRFGTVTSAPAVGVMLERERRSGFTTPRRYQRFSRDVTILRTKLLSFLAERKRKGERVAAYGAPAKGNTLLNYCGITSRDIEFTVDRSPHKQNRRLPGSGIPILAPDALLANMPAYTLILPWNISAEIVSQQREYCERGGRFVRPVPRPIVLGQGKSDAGETVQLHQSAGAATPA